MNLFIATSIVGRNFKINNVGDTYAYTLAHVCRGIKIVLCKIILIYVCRRRSASSRKLLLPTITVLIALVGGYVVNPSK